MQAGEKKKSRKLTKALLLTAIIIVIAQAINIYVVSNVKDEGLVLVAGFLKLTYVENTGGAFGIGANDTIGFVLINLLILGIIFRFMFAQIERIDKKTMLALNLILAGGISNLIDRIVRGFVVDYIDVSPIFKFPVFNLADMCIFFGWIMLVISIVIYWKKEVKNKR